MPATKTRKREPIRCFDGSAKPHEPFWRMVDAAESESGEPEIELYGVISEYSWWEDEVTPKKFRDDLYRLGGGGPVTVRINSPGGDVVAASVMRSILTDYPGRVTTRVDGLAASAAVAVATAGETVRIMDSAYMMIHDPAVIVFLAQLDIETLKGLAKDLQSIKRGLVDTYASRTGLTPEKISKMMQDETWMSAQEAVDYGFATEVISGGNKPAQALVNRAYVNILQSYANTPVDLLPEQPAEEEQEPEVVDEPDEPESSEQPAPVNIELEAQAQRLRERVATYLEKE